jgi:signal transduction histidine kinase
MFRAVVVSLSVLLGAMLGTWAPRADLPRVGPPVVLGLGGAAAVAALALRMRRRDPGIDREHDRAEAAVQRHTQRIRSLYEVAADAERSLDDQIVAALRLGCGWFGTEIGIVSRVEADVTIVEHVHTPADVLAPGQRFALADTYTELTLAAGGPVSFEDVASSPYQDHPARWVMRMAAFIGVPLVVHGRVFGTLGFAAAAPAPKPFDVYDHDVLQLLARWVGSVIERRQTAIELEEARDAALESARLKSEFVATMSHELRTPLNVIIGYADMLADPAMGPLEPAQRDLVERVMATSRALHGLITATLDLGRLEAGREAVVLEPVDLTLACCDLESELAPLVHDGVRLCWRHAAGLPPIVGDRGKLKTILKNVIGNALKFTDAGTVDVETGFDAGHLTVVVRDTGIGMTAAELGVVFDMFRQADASSTRRHGGVGLGLHIAKRLTALLGGTLAAESRPGVGSTFTLSVPARAVDGYRATG